jgi:hypothetical protein
MSYTPALGSKGVHTIFSTWGPKKSNNNVYKEKYVQGYERHTPRNTMNPLFRFKSHEAYKIKTNRLQESSKS